jgi:hypothetical protein
MTEQTTRRCSRCCEELAPERFSGGVRPQRYCKECIYEYHRDWRAKRKRQAESDSESDGEPSDPSGPSGPDPSAVPSARAPDLYIFANSLIPGMVKIGRSNDVERRRVELQRSHPFRLITIATFPGAGHLEAKVHLALHAHLVDGPGREWFSVAASDAIHAIAIAMR